MSKWVSKRFVNNSEVTLDPTTSPYICPDVKTEKKRPFVTINGWHRLRQSRCGYRVGWIERTSTVGVKVDGRRRREKVSLKGTRTLGKTTTVPSFSWSLNRTETLNNSWLLTVLDHIVTGSRESWTHSIDETPRYKLSWRSQEVSLLT